MSLRPKSPQGGQLGGTCGENSPDTHSGVAKFRRRDATRAAAAAAAPAATSSAPPHPHLLRHTIHMGQKLCGDPI